jgi:hypothetical protein
MVRTSTHTWMTATESDVDPLRNRIWTNRTEGTISGNRGIAISVEHVCMSNYYPLGSVSEASEHKIRGRSTGSSSYVDNNSTPTMASNHL